MGWDRTNLIGLSALLTMQRRPDKLASEKVNLDDAFFAPKSGVVGLSEIYQPYARIAAFHL
jgi:hypothetical protein